MFQRKQASMGQSLQVKSLQIMSLQVKSLQVKGFQLNAILLAAGLLLISACETNTALNRSQLLLVDDSELKTSALQSWNQALKSAKVSTNKDQNQRLRNVGARIVKAAGLDNQPWEYVLFDNPEPNAFVIPGNKVGVNTGLFKIVLNDDQLAAVIGHETAHVIAKHAAERYSQQMATSVGLSILGAVTEGDAKTLVANYGGLGAQLGLLLPYSRKHELEADQIGVDLMVKAGYRASQAIEVWRNMAAQRKGQAAIEIISTHPTDATRIKALQDYIVLKGYS
jgi:predicted Zn-dependent protease